MNAPTLVELRTAVAALHQKRMNEIAPKHYRTERDYFTLLAELNLTHQLNTKLEEELKLKLPSAQFLNWLKALYFIDHERRKRLAIYIIGDDQQWASPFAHDFLEKGDNVFRARELFIGNQN